MSIKKNRGGRKYEGKVVAELKEDSYWGTVHIYFTDGSFIRMSPYTTGSHNDRWSAIDVTYFEKEN